MIAINDHHADVEISFFAFFLCYRVMLLFLLIAVCALQGTEFCDKAGFDALFKHMRDGSDSCRCFLDFIRQRFN